MLLRVLKLHKVSFLLLLYETSNLYLTKGYTSLFMMLVVRFRKIKTNFWWLQDAEKIICTFKKRVVKSPQVGINIVLSKYIYIPFTTPDRLIYKVCPHVFKLNEKYFKCDFDLIYVQLFENFWILLFTVFRWRKTMWIFVLPSNCFWLLLKRRESYNRNLCANP